MAQVTEFLESLEVTVTPPWVVAFVCFIMGLISLFAWRVLRPRVKSIRALTPIPQIIKFKNILQPKRDCDKNIIMAAIKVHGSPISTATQRVLVCLHEKGLDFEFVNIDMSKGEHKKEPYLSLNPFGQVPALEHGDLKLFESRAITQYIAHENPNNGTQLISTHGKQMAIQTVWMEVEGQQFEPVASKLNWELVFKNFFGKQADAAVVEELEGKLAKVLDIYESRLAKSKYLAGDSFTLADMHHLPNIQLLMGTKCKTLFESRPHVSAWVADITSRPSWAKVLAMQGK